MGFLEASATVRWSGWAGTVAGDIGALNAPTATQEEFGAPGQPTNPEELLAAAHATCFTSTLTSLARARGVMLADAATAPAVRVEQDDDDHDHHPVASDLSLVIR